MNKLSDAQEQALCRLLFEKGERLYAIHDAAQEIGLLDEMQRSGVVHECLFDGVKAITLRTVAPYLIPCQHYAQQEKEFVNCIWSKGVSMVIESKSSIELLKLHLKKNAFIKNSNGAQCYFRYYDARAFSRFVRMATTGQLSQLFGNAVQSIIWHDSEFEELRILGCKQPSLFNRILEPGMLEFDVYTLT